MDKIGSQISDVKNIASNGVGKAENDKSAFDDQLAAQRRKIGTPVVKSMDPQVTTIQLGKVMSAAARTSGETAAVYETTRTVGLGDLVDNLSTQNSFGAESNIKSLLKNIPQDQLPEVAIVSAESLGENAVTFTSAVIGDTMFLSEKVYDNWCCGQDEGQLEVALENITSNWLASS